LRQERDEAPNLRSNDPQARVAALERLAAATVTHEEIDAAAACLGATEKLVQRRAAEAFARLHRAGIDIEPALSLAVRSTDLRQRWGAAFAFSLIGALPPEARDILVDSLGLDDGDIRWAAADILLRSSEIDDRPQRLTQLLVHGNPHQRKMAAYCLRRLDLRSPAVDRALLAALEDRSAAVRLATLAALSRLATDRAVAAQHLAHVLDDTDPGVRRAAAVALGDLGEARPETLAALRQAAASDDGSLCRAARRSLEKLVGRPRSAT